MGFILEKTTRGFWGIVLQWVFVLLFVVASTASATDSGEQKKWLPELLEKESLTLVITDSGLGGLSVVADAVEKFRRYSEFKKVDIIFYNALFTSQGGYNSLGSREEKLKVFNRALRDMAERYVPDAILVACNTLSVLIPDTEFAADSQIPIVGIVGNGVDQIAEQLGDNDLAQNIIFATQTTIEEGAHRKQLLQKGFKEEQISGQACPELTLYIERGFDSMETEMLIDAYVDEALASLGQPSGPLSVSFNCTHYGYSLELWKRAFVSRGVKVSAFLNPNTRMVDFLLPKELRQRYPNSEITVKVVSMTDIPSDRLASIGRCLRKVSPTAAVALESFELDSGLFKWRDLVDTK